MDSYDLIEELLDKYLIGVKTKEKLKEVLISILPIVAIVLLLHFFLLE